MQLTDQNEGAPSTSIITRRGEETLQIEVIRHGDEEYDDMPSTLLVTGLGHAARIYLPITEDVTV